jgi:circadian clock protein KaiC
VGLNSEIAVVEPSAGAEEVLDSLVGHLAGRHQPADMASPEEWSMLFRQTQVFVEAQPWRRLSDEVHLRMELRIGGVSTHGVGVILGNAGISATGVAPSQARESFVLGTLIALLVTFIGEDLTFRVLRGVWPDLPMAQSVPSYPSNRQRRYGDDPLSIQDSEPLSLTTRDREPTYDGVIIHQLPTGVRGLDEVLGGGLPEYSFNLIAGAPGTGKTTLSQQLMFALATPARPALHFTVVGEPSLKLLRYQQRFSFFDAAKLGDSVHYVNLTHETLEQGLGAVLETMVAALERVSPGIVVVDSFMTVVRVATMVQDGGMELQGFLERLALRLTTWQATSFLVGEYEESEAPKNHVFNVADGILWLYQSIDRNSGVRKMQVAKMRGQAPLPGLHTLRITKDGLEIFPRIMQRSAKLDRPRPNTRLSTGVAGLDEMLGGGIPAWDSLLVSGPAGSGKSALASQFVAAGLAKGEPAVIAVFEEHPNQFLAHSRTMAPRLDTMARDGLLEVIYLRPLGLSVDEALLEIQAAVKRTNAQRLVIDSLSGFELALAPTFREDFRESLYRMVGALTGSGVTVFMTTEVGQSFTDLRFSSHLISFLADDVIVQRYVEIEGEMRNVMNVVKMRGSRHSCAYTTSPSTAWWWVVRSATIAASSRASLSVTTVARLEYRVDDGTTAGAAGGRYCAPRLLAPLRPTPPSATTAATLECVDRRSKDERELRPPAPDEGLAWRQ